MLNSHAGNELFRLSLGGSTDWQSNLAIETQVLPYRDDLRLLVIHVKTKNPRSATFELESRAHDSFDLRVRSVALDAKVWTIFAEDQGDLLANVDLLALSGGAYEFLPGAEMDDMLSVVLPAGSSVAVTAEVQQRNGTVDRRGKPDIDSNSVSTVVHIS